jgi:hypothetical protein
LGCSNLGRFVFGAVILTFFLKIKIVQQFFDRNWIFIFSLYFADFVFSRQKIAKEQKKLFLEIGQSGCKKIQNFMLISDLKKLFRKNVPKKLDQKNNFFWGLGRTFLEKQFFGIIYFFSL